jgi:desulfoferrodoxin (superoxide reductase-like protein)
MSEEMSRRGFVSFAGSVVLGSWLPGCMADVGVGDGFASSSRYEPWEEEARALEGARVYDRTTPWMGEDKAGTHVPQPSATARAITVTVPHPMTSAHYITTIYARDQDGIVVWMAYFAPPEEGEDSMGISVTMSVLDNVSEVTAYAHCNLHDVWRSDPLPLV